MYYKYASFTLGNGADQILLLTPGGQLADGIAYDDGVLWPDTPGTAAALDAASHDATANDDGGNWCNALTPQSPGSPDEGTPGERNATCP